MEPIMREIANFLSCKLLIIKNYNYQKLLKFKTIDTLSAGVYSLDKITYLINYFYKFPLLGTKSKDFKDWVAIYKIIKSKKHLTESGISQIKSISSNMNRGRLY